MNDQTVATHKPFKSAAMAYNLIEKYVREHTTAMNPTTIQRIYDALKDDLKNIQQVKDAVKRFRANGKFSAVREGQALSIWWRNYSGATTNGGLTPPSVAAASLPKNLQQKYTTDVAVKPSDMPEVHISKTSINIIAGGVKITIERQ